MSDASTIALLDMYMEDVSVIPFLTGFFKSPARNYFTSEEVEIDIQRSDESVAIVVTDLSLGPRHNESTLWTNKSYTPPILWEEGAVSAFDMIKRQPGSSPYLSPDYAANATKNAFSIYRKCEEKIRRAVELMCAQVLQTGKLTLIGKDGVPLYELDFSPKASHFLGATGGAWAVNGATGDPLANLGALATTLRRDGKREPNVLIFGDSALQRFMANVNVKAALDNRRIEIGLIAPETRGFGQTFYGYVWVGAYRFEMYTYDATYKHPQTGVTTPYVGTNNVIMMSSTARLEMCWGAIPMIIPPDQRVLPFLPPRISSSSAGIDLTTNAWCDPSGTHVMVSAGTRPLALPVAIDTFGRLDTSVAA